MNYQIFPVYLGSLQVDAPTMLYRYPQGETYTMAMGAFVLKDENGEFILVDTGAPSVKEIREKGYPFRQMADSLDYIEEIKKLGVEPEQVKLIIMTHLHWDHAWNMENFPNAQVLVTRTELAHAINPPKTSLKSYAMLKETNGPNWLHALLQIKGLDGDAEIRPGLRVIMTPGHTPGSLSVLVDTKDGLHALVSDIGMCTRNFTDGVPTGSVESIADWYRSYERVMALNAVLLPTHVISVYDKKVYG